MIPDGLENIPALFTFELELSHRSRSMKQCFGRCRVTCELTKLGLLRVAESVMP